MGFTRIDIARAQELIAAAPDNGLQVVDVRDEESYAAGHIEGAWHLDGSNVQEFLSRADPDKPLLVYCYHGHMSQGAAAYFAEQGFTHSYSLDGGFEAWRGNDTW